MMTSFSVPTYIEIEIALFPFRVCRVRDEFAVNPTNLHGADRAGKGNVGNAKRRGSTINREMSGSFSPSALSRMLMI